MLPQWIIEKKRDGHKLSAEEIDWFIQGYTKDIIPDYQMAALAMAIYFKGMTLDEAACLTESMMRSGRVVDTAAIKLPKVDKHSTGGIGDKVSLILAPLAAVCGVAVPMISGRGLGITGGTLDKLESIPGFNVNLSEPDFLKIIQKSGLCLIGQTKDIAPADKKLYGLRDVTATVPSIPLIVGSIMCKKLAEGIDALVLDVKVGSGAFMKTLPEARQLAEWLVKVGQKMGKKVSALITEMNEPLGRTAGNSLEVIESVECLKGAGPKDLMELTMELTAEMLILSGVSRSRDEALAKLSSKIESGEAFMKFKEITELQGGDSRALDDFSLLPTAGFKEPFLADVDGFVRRVDAEGIGRACVVLGAGRLKVSDSVDHGVGVSGLKKTGESVRIGEPLCFIHANDRGKLGEAREFIRQSFVLGQEAPEPRRLILEKVS